MVNSVALLEETKIFRVHKTSSLKILSIVVSCGIRHDGLSVATLKKRSNKWHNKLLSNYQLFPMSETLFNILLCNAMTCIFKCG